MGIDAVNFNQMSLMEKLKDVLNPIEVVKDRLMNLISRLPNGDYNKIMKEFWR